MDLEHGTESEHLGTLQRAYDADVDYIWSGDLRNPYLHENLNYAIDQGILEAEFVEYYEAQESGYLLTWLKRPTNET